MIDDKYKNYLHDLGFLLKEKAFLAKQEKDAAVEKKDADYQIGYLMAFHEIISLMKQQADSFYIDHKDIGLWDINPEKDLL